jgi:integrase
VARHRLQDERDSVRAYNFAGQIDEERYKTEAGERDVPLFKSIRQLLLERKARQRFSGDDDFVFASTIGTPLDPNNFVRRELKPAIDGANAERAKHKLPAIPPFRWHGFRHYAVSILINQRADILLLARIAGHKDPSVTLGVYAHLMNDSLTEAAEQFDPLRRAAVR